MKSWDVLETRYLLRRWWMNVRVDRVQLANGEELEEYHVIESPDWVGVLCLTQEGQVVMVEQYRHGAGTTTRELPAGVVEEGESPEEAARRELLEETGYVAESWLPLGSCAPEPSRSTHQAHFFFADRARRKRPPRQDLTEDLEVQLHAPTQVLEWADDGTILHASHRMAILLAACRGLL